MPQAFTTLMPFYESVNTYGQIENCYYCTIAALLGMTTDSLVNRSEIMMQDTATSDEIVQLMNAAGIAAANYTDYTDTDGLHTLIDLLDTLPPGQAVGLAYNRVNGTGHMIVAYKDENDVTGFIDYQTTPPTVTQEFPEPISTLTSFTLFYSGQ